MPKVIFLSGPIGAGKTTLARKLISRLPGSVASIEGDTFWSFIKKSEKLDRRENFHVIMRSMTAATIPLVRSGYAVLLDFSVPPHFLDTARKILKELPWEYIILKPALAVCAARAAARPEGAIADYSPYAEFYELFQGHEKHTVDNGQSSDELVLAQILEGLNNGRFRM